jgi:hypothetical protein
MSTTVTTYPELDRALERWESITIVGLDLGYKELEGPEFRLEDCYGKGPATVNAGIVEIVDSKLWNVTTDAAIVRVYDSRLETITAPRAERVLIVDSYIGRMEVNDRTEVVLLNAYVGQLSGGKIAGTKRSYLEVDFEQGVELDLI